MNRALTQLEDNIRQVRSLGAAYVAVEAYTTTLVDGSDILRAQLVLAVSAFDHFIHELVRLGMLATHRGDRPQPAKYDQFSIPLGVVRTAFETPDDVNWLEAAIRNNISYKSFQKAKNVENALGYITDEPVWERVANALERDENGLKVELDLIVDRRNQIAHQADINPTDPETRYPIDQEEVGRAILFIENISRQIHAVVME